MRNNPSDSVDGFLGYANQIYRGLGYLIDKLSTVLIEKMMMLWFQMTMDISFLSK